MQDTDPGALMAMVAGMAASSRVAFDVLMDATEAPSQFDRTLRPFIKSHFSLTQRKRIGRSAYMPHQGGGRAHIDRKQAMARKNAA